MPSSCERLPLGTRCYTCKDLRKACELQVEYDADVSGPLQRNPTCFASPPLRPRQQALGDTAYNEMTDRGYKLYYEQRARRYTARFYTTWPRKDYSLLLAWKRLESASLSLFRLC